MTPSTKKIVSTFGVGVGVAALGTLVHYVVKLSPELQTGAFSVIASALYAINSWGTQQGIDQQVLAKVTEAVSKEGT